MLNLEEIAQRIAQPTMCSSNDLEDLKLFSEKYPYSQVFPLLYLNTLAINADVRFDEELHKYAYRISDRAQLYQLIHQNNSATSLPVQTDKMIVSTVEVPVNIDKQDSVEVTQQEFVKPISDNKGEAIEVILTPILAAEELDENLEDEEGYIPLTIASSEEKIQALNEERIIEPIVNEPSSFDKEIIAEAINSNFNLDHIQAQPTEVIEEQNLEEEDPHDEITAVFSSETIEKQSFSSWLQSNEAQKRAFFDEEKDRIDSILTKFIEDEPKISRPDKEIFEPVKEKTEFFSPLKKAKQSLDSTAMPVSETLAKIFAVQGNYPKAIYAYEQLCLIYPEKKIFFASQIEELKQKLNT